jgi:hypothetical protein
MVCSTDIAPLPLTPSREGRGNSKKSPSPSMGEGWGGGDTIFSANKY